LVLARHTARRVDSFHRRHRVCGYLCRRSKSLTPMPFCTSCHEMNEPFQEYRHGMHYSNVLGIQASCGKLPRPPRLVPGLIRHIQASREVWGHLIFELSTACKYEAHRLELAQKVWKDLKEHDSAECRSCHTASAMAFAKHLRRRRMSINRWRRTARLALIANKGVCAHAFPGQLSARLSR